MIHARLFPHAPHFLAGASLTPYAKHKKHIEKLRRLLPLLATGLLLQQLCACSTPFAYQQTGLLHDTATQARQAAQRLSSASNEALTYELLAPTGVNANQPGDSLQGIVCFRDANLYLNQRAVAVIAASTEAAEKVSHLDDNPLNAQVLKKLRSKHEAEALTPGQAPRGEVDKLATFFDRCQHQLTEDQPALANYVPTPSAANVALLKEAEVKQPTALLPSVIANTLALDSLTREIVTALESAQKEEAIRSTLKASLPQLHEAIATLRDDARLERTLDRLRLLALRKVLSRYQQLQQHRQLANFPQAEDIGLAETLAGDISQYQALTSLAPTLLLKQLDEAATNITHFAEAGASNEDNLADLAVGLITIKEQMALLANVLDHSSAGNMPG